MNVLITGGAGFIGSHLAGALIKNGDRVSIIDDISTGAAENVAHLRDHPQFFFINGSILNRELMEEMIDDCDIVYHLAAAVGVKYIMANRLKAFDVNVRGTEIVLELASKDKKKVMIASSSEIYGKNGKVPYKEDDDRVLGSTTLHRWSYSCTKALDEFLALAYWWERALPVVIMRFFNTVGPRQLGRYGMVVPRFVEYALSGAPLTVYGDGSQTRCFTDVDDVVRAISSLAECPDAVGHIFNVGSDEEVSINDLASRTIGLAGGSSAIEYVPYYEAYGEGFEDMKRRVPDISKIYEFIGWKPEVRLDDILVRMIAYSKQTRPNLAVSEQSVQWTKTRVETANYDRSMSP